MPKASSPWYLREKRSPRVGTYEVVCTLYVTDNKYLAEPDPSYPPRVARYVLGLEGLNRMTKEILKSCETRLSTLQPRVCIKNFIAV